MSRAYPAGDTQALLAKAKANVLVAWGEVTRLGGDHDGAMEFYQASLRTLPRGSTANFHVGKSLFDRGRTLESTFYLRHSLDDPEWGDEAKRMLAVVRDTVISVDDAPTTGAAADAPTTGAAAGQ